MHLETLVDIAEDGPWCGTHPPGRPRPVVGPDSPPRFRETDLEPASWRSLAGPQPDPWRLAAVEAGLYAAIRLHQLGRQVTGPIAREFGAAAEIVFGDTCGSVPLSVLIWLLLHRPPPPPPPWLDTLVFTGEVLAFAQRTQREALAAAATRQLGQALGAFAEERQARAAA